jgi:alpha-galactosidase
MCHELVGVAGRLRSLFGMAPDAPFQARVVGVNHFTWLLDFWLDGQNGYRLLDQHLSAHPLSLPFAGALPATPQSVFEDRLQLKLWLYQTYGLLPAAGDRHIAEFLPGILGAETSRGADFGVELTTIEHRRASRARRRAWVEAVVDGAESPRIARSHEALAEITLGLAETREVTHVMNLPNEGQAGNLPRDAIVETMGVISPAGARPIAAGDLPPAVLAVVLPHVLRQEITVEAGLRGDRALALQALASDPMVRNPRDAELLLDDLLRAHARYLPQF